MNEYVPIPGFFDLSKLDLPPRKHKVYSDLQKLAAHYRITYNYQKQHNKIQLDHLKKMCAEMQMDLILNYDAIEKGV